MAGLRDLKRRIKSVQSTRKITRAMQMVSAAKMRKAQNAVMSSRTYSNLAWDLVMSLAKTVPPLPSNNSQLENEDENVEIRERPQSIFNLLIAHPDAGKIGVIMLSTNRGFVGSLNTNLLPKVNELGRDTEIVSEVVVYGKKAKNLLNSLRKKISADFEKTDKTLTAEEIYPLAKYITDIYLTGEYKKIVLVYNHFVSTLIQKPTVKQLLPFTELAVANNDGEVDTLSDYIFEPSPEQVLGHLLPRIVESQIYQAILESDASEHSARMVMMKNATEAAGDLISDYTLTYNQLRQNKITTELAEITAGKIALE